MKVILITILALTLVGCQGLKQGVTQQPPGTMATGNWEFVLQKNSTQNIYVESSIRNTETAGTYAGGGSAVFSFDHNAYFADPAAGAGYEFGGTASAFTMTINSQLAVSGTLTQSGGSSLSFTGTVDATGMSMTGTFNDGSGDSGSFSASATDAPGGYYSDGTDAITESISGSMVTETSQYGSGNYQLMPSLGNFAVLLSDIPVGGNGSVVFWNNSGVCSGNQCAVWVDTSNHCLWVLMSNQSSDTNKVVGLLLPPA